MQLLIKFSANKIFTLTFQLMIRIHTQETEFTFFAEHFGIKDLLCHYCLGLLIVPLRESYP